MLIRFHTLAIYCIFFLFAFRNESAVAQTETPQLLSHSTYGSARTIALYSDWLYASSGTSLRIFDIGDINNPVERGHLHFDGAVQELEVQWPVLIIAVSQGGVILADVSDPNSPGIIGQIEEIKSVGRLVVGADSLLFIAALQEGTFVYSIKEPSQPQKIAHIPINGEEAEAVDVVNIGDQLIVAGKEDGWRVFDISKPSEPKIISHTMREIETVGLAANDSLLFVAYLQQPRSMISIYHADLLTSPTSLADIEVNAFVPFLRMATQSNLLVGTSSGVGILLIDVGMPEAPTQLAYRRAAGNSLVFKEDIIYLVDRWSRAVEILKVGDTFALQPVDTIFTGTSVRFVRSHGDRRFVSNFHYKGLLSELHLPQNTDEVVQVSSLFIPASRLTPSPSSNLIYVMPEGYFVDISNQGSMSVFSKASKDHMYGVGNRKDAAWINDTLLINTVDGEHHGDKGGIELFSVSDPLQPRFLDLYETLTWNNGSVIVQDTLAFVTAYTSFLIMSVASGSTIEPIGRLPFLYAGYELAIQGNYAYVHISRNDGQVDSLVTIDCSNPTMPTIANQLELNFKPSQFLIHEKNLLVIDNSTELRVFSLSAPAEPKLIQTYSFPNPILWIDITNDNRLLTANGESGLQVWDLPLLTNVEEVDSESPLQPTTFILYPVYPNPGRTEFKLSYRLLAPAEIRMTIFNILGQKVKTFIRSLHVPGSYTITWDGTNNANLQAHNGVYFAQLSVAGHINVRKFVLIR